MECIENPFRMPYLKIGVVYDVLENHPTRQDYFKLKSDNNTTAFYKKCWFKKAT